MRFVLSLNNTLAGRMLLGPLVGQVAFLLGDGRAANGGGGLTGAESHRRGVEDFALMALAMEGGLTATITAGRIGWSSHFGAGPNLTRLCGSQGSLKGSGELSCCARAIILPFAQGR